MVLATAIRRVDIVEREGCLRGQCFLVRGGCLYYPHLQLCAFRQLTFYYGGDLLLIVDR